MGICCGGESKNTNQVNGDRKRTKVPNPGLSDEFLSVDAVFDQQRRLTKAQRESQAAEMISFKGAMKFKTIQRFASLYSKRKEIGQGAFGTVHIGQHRQTSMPCAIKTIKKTKLNEAEVYQELNKNELEILEVTQHPNITRVFELLEDQKNYYIIMEVITGGNLLDKIATMNRFTESQAAHVIKQILLALNFMHKKNIMHRDLKPENLLCEENADDVNNDEIYVKLTDFGFATKYDPNNKQTLSLGSPMYMAPELVKEEPYDYKVDCWATGVITYILLTGTPPFYDRRHPQNPTKQGMYNDIAQNEPDYNLLRDVSEDAISFIQGALDKNPGTRTSIEQMLNHSWIQDNQRADSRVDNQTQLDLSANLHNFAKTNQFQSGVCSILANLMTKTEDLKDLHKLFMQWDSNNDGELSLEELKENMAAITDLFQLQEPDVIAMMKKADTNGDGNVDYSEFIAAAFDKVKLLTEPNLQKAFKIFDQDGDGNISPEELKRVFGGGAVGFQQGENVWNEILREVDSNNDGQISYEEFKVCMYSVIQKRATFVNQQK